MSPATAPLAWAAILCLACYGNATTSTSPSPFPATLEDAAVLFIRYATQGDYDRLAALIVDTQGKSLTEGEISTHKKAWMTSWGKRPDVDVTNVTVTSRVRLSEADLKRFRTDTGYRLTLKTEGSSRTPCFKVPQDRSSVVVISTRNGWRVVEEIPEEFVPRC